GPPSELPRNSLLSPRPVSPPFSPVFDPRATPSPSPPPEDTRFGVATARRFAAGRRRAGRALTDSPPPVPACSPAPPPASPSASPASVGRPPRTPPGTAA